MKKRLVFSLFVLILFASCANFKVITKRVDDNFVSFKKPLIVVPYNSITESTSKRFQRKLSECLINNNIEADFYLFEIKQDVLKLNDEKKSLIDELSPICDRNKNDGIIFFKYDKYNYGAYGVSFSQEVFAINKDTKKTAWYARGYTNFDGIRQYCEEITNKMISEKVLLKN